MTDFDPSAADQADELVSAYLDNEVTEAERARVEANPDLMARVTTFRAARDAVAQPVTQPDPAVRAAQIAAAVASASTSATVTPLTPVPEPARGTTTSQAAATNQAGEVTSLADARERRRGFNPAVAAALGAAAVILLFVVGLSVLNLGGGDDETSTAGDTTAASADSDTGGDDGFAEGDSGGSDDGAMLEMEAAEFDSAGSQDRQGDGDEGDDGDGAMEETADEAMEESAADVMEEPSFEAADAASAAPVEDDDVATDSNPPQATPAPPIPPDVLATFPKLIIGPAPTVEVLLELVAGGTPDTATSGETVQCADQIANAPAQAELIEQLLQASLDGEPVEVAVLLDITTETRRALILSLPECTTLADTPVP